MTVKVVTSDRRRLKVIAASDLPEPLAGVEGLTCVTGYRRTPASGQAGSAGSTTLHAVFLTTKSGLKKLLNGWIARRSPPDPHPAPRGPRDRAEADVGPIQVLDILNVDVDDDLPADRDGGDQRIGAHDGRAGRCGSCRTSEQGRDDQGGQAT